jgi:hypothetical protein
MNMKWLIYNLILITGLAIGLKSLHAQTGNNIFDNEKIYLITDRDFYCVDEKILFKAFDLELSKPACEDWSHILYIDLLTPDGRLLVSEKFMLENNKTAGALQIPANVLSGNYYLRANTKWMRNQSPYSFFYKKIKIINPYSIELLSCKTVPDSSMLITKQFKKDERFLKLSISSDSIPVNSNFQLKIYSSDTDSFRNDLSVSFIRKGCNRSDELILFNPVDKKSEIKYIPETRGVTISGRIVSRRDSLPVPFAMVWITLLEKNPVSYEVMADSTGNFNFNLGENSGRHELFIQAFVSKETVSPIILVDNDFAYTTLNLPFETFDIDNNEKDLAEDVIINSQLNHIYKNKESADSSSFAFNHYFYGNPDEIIYLEKYIEMPLIEDYIRELLPNVHIKRETSKTIFKISGQQTEMDIFDPLVMIDLIKIENANLILDLSPKVIDHIEVIYKPYVYGENTYGGILHFISKKGDISKLKFPEESMFLDYKLISPAAGNNQNSLSPHVPVVGNCLYWNPSFRIQKGQDNIINLNTGSEPGNYEIVIEGLDLNFQPFILRKDITVF